LPKGNQMTAKVYILSVETQDLSLLYSDALISDNRFRAFNILMNEVKSETNDECDLSRTELLEFDIRAA